jgi:hypothetical protein
MDRFRSSGESSYGYELLEVSDQQAGPGLEVRSPPQGLAHVLRRRQLSFEHVALADVHGSRAVGDVHEAQVHGADRIGVIVEVPDQWELVVALGAPLPPRSRAAPLR